MRQVSAVAGSVMLVLGLVGCGGGGGGGGGAGFPIAAGGASTVTPPPTTPTPQTTPVPASSVSVQGAKLTTDASGAYLVKPGDVVSVDLGTDVIWSSASEIPDAVSSSTPRIGNKTWSATLFHDGAAEEKFLLNARYGSAADDVLKLVFKVAAADALNGTYRMFSAVGTEFKYKVNFDLKQYVLQDRSGAPIRSGTLEADPTTAGTYVMVDPVTKSAPTNNARFRVTGDALVGATWVPVQFPNPQNIQTMNPFVATRTLLTSKAELDGVYNRLDLTRAPGSGPGSFGIVSSGLHETQISGQGTVLAQCIETNTISRLSACNGPGRTVARYTASATADAEGRWTFTNDVDPNDKLVLTVARIAGENVLLEAGVDSLTPARRVFRVGVPRATSWPTATAYGGGDVANWSKYSIGATAIDVASKALDGSENSESYPLTDPFPTEPQGWKKASTSFGSIAFAMQGKGLYVLMAGASSYSGYVHLGLTQ